LKSILIMIIEDKLFTNKYRIKRDSHQYAIQRKYKKKWKSFQYHVSIGDAVSKILTLLMSSKKETVTLEEYVKRYETAHREVKQRLNF
jgi:hypothetical protein